MKLSQIAGVLQKYLIDHSARRLNFLYWNIVEPKDCSLCFVNLNGKELTRVNNEDLAFRIVKVLSRADWDILAEFINTYIVDDTDKRAVYVVRVDYLMSYLKSIGYDLTKFGLRRTGFGTGFSVTAEESLSKPICTLDNDIQSLHLIDRLYSKYRRVVNSDPSDCTIVDITDEYLKTPDYRYKIQELKVAIPMSDCVDSISKKFSAKLDSPFKIEAISLENGITKLVNRFSGVDMIVLSVRVYLQYFLQKYKSKKGE